jgi:MoxR-like ATPase
VDGAASGPAEGARAGSLSSIEEIRLGLKSVGYVGDEAIATAVYLAGRLEKPILVEGPAGVGKTELAKAVARLVGARLIRLQCHEGIDESKALYEWNYRKQLLAIQAERAGAAFDANVRPEASTAPLGNLNVDIFGRDYLLERPLLEAIQAPDTVVLLIDEVDRVELETEALFLEVLSEYQISVPELGTVAATRVPLVLLTSNGSRALSEALRRRCLYLHLDYPLPAREREILHQQVPGLSAHLTEEVVSLVSALRELELDKLPSVAESIDFARSLLLLGVTELDAKTTRSCLHVLCKLQGDIETAVSQLALSPER